VPKTCGSADAVVSVIVLVVGVIVLVVAAVEVVVEVAVMVVVALDAFDDRSLQPPNDAATAIAAITQAYLIDG
jgi:hypothetical protein